MMMDDGLTLRASHLSNANSVSDNMSASVTKTEVEMTLLDPARDNTLAGVSTTEVEMTQLELASDKVQSEAETLQPSLLALEIVENAPTGVLVQTRRPSHPQRSVSFGPSSHSEPNTNGYAQHPLLSFRSYPSATVHSTLGEEEIALVEDVDIDMSIPTSLITMDFPKPDDGHEEDVAKVIRKSFSKLGLRHGEQDALSVLSKANLSFEHISLMSQIESALEGQEPEDHFWEMASGDLINVEVT